MPVVVKGLEVTCTLNSLMMDALSIVQQVLLVVLSFAYFLRQLETIPTASNSQAWVSCNLHSTCPSNLPADLCAFWAWTKASLEPCTVATCSQQPLLPFSCCSHPGVAGVGMQRVYVHESCGEDGLLNTLARLTGEGYAITDNGQLTFNDKKLCQGAYWKL